MEYASKYPCSNLKQENLAVKNFHIDGLVKEKRNYIAIVLELRLSGTNSSTWCEYKLITIKCIGLHVKHI